MNTVLDQVKGWFERGRSVALATVIRTWGSSPRPAGALMAVTDQAEISGSVSGGCVEGAVVDAALGVLADGRPVRLKFGVADEEAWEVGLSCGGEIEIHVRQIDQEYLDYWSDARSRWERFCIPLVIEGGQDFQGAGWIVFGNGEYLGKSSFPDPPSEVLASTHEALTHGRSSLEKLDSDQVREVFLLVEDPPQRLILVGGVHIAIPLVSLATTLGFEVIVIDPRRLFGTTDRFPAVSKLIQEWPQTAFGQLNITETTAIVMLTHDPKIDDPALKIALDSQAFYIGALGSRKTHQKRLSRLTEQGVDPSALNRIHAPVGLDLGASTPEEIALAVMAEIVQVWHKRG